MTDLVSLFHSKEHNILLLTQSPPMFFECLLQFRVRECFHFLILCLPKFSTLLYLKLLGKYLSTPQTNGMDTSPAPAPPPQQPRQLYQTKQRIKLIQKSDTLGICCVADDLACCFQVFAHFSRNI